MGLGFINKVIPAQLQKNLIAYYRLDGDALDYSGNGYHGIAYNPIWVNEMNFGKNWKNNGEANSYIESSVPLIERKFTISYFFKKTYNPYRTNGWQFSYRIGDNIYVIYEYMSNFYIQIFNSEIKVVFEKASSPFLFNTIYHLTLVSNYNDVKLYVNGNAITFDEIINENLSTALPISNNNELRIGKLGFFYNRERFFKYGNIQMVAIFNKELTPTEVMQNYQKQLTQFLK